MLKMSIVFLKTFKCSSFFVFLCLYLFFDSQESIEGAIHNCKAIILTCFWRCQDIAAFLKLFVFSVFIGNMTKI